MPIFFKLSRFGRNDEYKGNKLIILHYKGDYKYLNITTKNCDFSTLPNKASTYHPSMPYLESLLHTP